MKDRDTVRKAVISYSMLTLKKMLLLAKLVIQISKQWLNESLSLLMKTNNTWLLLKVSFWLAVETLAKI